MNLYKVTYQDRNGRQFSKIIWALSPEVAKVRAQQGIKRNTIICFQEIPISENRKTSEV